MGFPMVPKSVTLDDLERRNGCHFKSLIFMLSLYSWLNKLTDSYFTKPVKVVNRPTLSASKG